MIYKPIVLNKISIKYTNTEHYQPKSNRIADGNDDMTFATVESKMAIIREKANS